MRSSRFPLLGLAGLVFSVVSVGSSLLAAERFDPVSVTTEPAGATVIVDGCYGGITPMVLNLSRKLAHSVRIELEGYHPQVTQVEPAIDWFELSKNALGGPLKGLICGSVDVATDEARRLGPNEIQATLVRIGEVDRLVLPVVAKSLNGL